MAHHRLRGKRAPLLLSWITTAKLSWLGWSAQMPKLLKETKRSLMGFSLFIALLSDKNQADGQNWIHFGESQPFCLFCVNESLAKNPLREWPWIAEWRGSRGLGPLDDYNIPRKGIALLTVQTLYRLPSELAQLQIQARSSQSSRASWALLSSLNKLLKKIIIIVFYFKKNKLLNNKCSCFI